MTATRFHDRGIPLLRHRAVDDMRSAGADGVTLLLSEHRRTGSLKDEVAASLFLLNSHQHHPSHPLGWGIVLPLPRYIEEALSSSVLSCDDAAKGRAPDCHHSVTRGFLSRLHAWVSRCANERQPTLTCHSGRVPVIPSRTASSPLIPLFATTSLCFADFMKGF